MSGVTVRLLKNNAVDAEKPPLMLMVPSTLDELHKQAGKKLGMTVKYSYASNGALLDDVDILRDDELVFCSETEGFYKNAAASAGNDPGSSSKPLKISIMGPGGVGKSCLTIRYTKSTFVETYDPTIEDAFRHQVVIDDRVVVLEILDTAGQEEFKCLAQQWVENKHGFLLVFNVVERDSLNDVQSFLQLIADEYESQDLRQPPIVLVANKIDLVAQRKVTTEEALQKVSAWGLQGYVEASAKTGENVEKAFGELVRAIRQRTGPATATSSSSKSSSAPLTSSGSRRGAGSGIGGCILL